MADASLIGRELPGGRLPVERGKVRELAIAVGDEDPIYRDDDAAAASGFERIPAPLTYTVTLTHWMEGELGGFDELGLDLGRLLHGDATWEYLAPVFVGDVLDARRTVTHVATREGKRGGEMTLVTVETLFTNQDGEHVIRSRDTLIEREA